MANEFLAVSNETFTLQESENKNQLYFYRNDGKVLTDIDSEPMDLYHAYILQKMSDNEIEDFIAKDIYFETSVDKKCIRLTICDIGEKPVQSNNSTVKNEQSKFLKRLFHKIFG